jgi:hypothetical protein
VVALSALLVWTVWAVSLVFVLFGLSVIPSGDTVSTLGAEANILAALTLVSSGAVLITRLPRNPIGWLLWLGGFMFAVSNGSTGLPVALLDRGIPGAIWLIWLGGLLWVPAIVCVLVMIPLLFPTGRLPSQRWRAVALGGVFASVASAVQGAFSPFAPGTAPDGVMNPIAADAATQGLLSMLSVAASLSGIVCLPLVAASLVRRYRQSSGVERAQLKWFAAVVAIVGPALVVGIVTGGSTIGPLGTVTVVAWLITLLGLAMLPAAIGLAILRYRLYDIDIIIRRTAIYVPLTAILAGLYAASIALFQRLFVAATGHPSDGAVIMSTLILATTFTPIKSWLQTIVDLHFREAEDPERLFDGFVKGLASAQWAPDPARTIRAFLVLSVRAMGAVGGAGYVGSGVDERFVAETQTRSGQVALIQLVQVGGRRIGRIEFDTRPAGVPYDDEDIEVLAAAAARVAAAIIEFSDPSPAATC